MKRLEFRSGLRDGVPVCIGYFSVSFGFGALAVTCGLEVLQATLISLTNLTSAGQFAGLTAMTFPAILYAADHVLSGAAALAVAVVLSLRGRGLVAVAAGSCVAVFLSERIVSYLPF